MVMCLCSLITISFFTLFLPLSSLAKIAGELCSTCHTMHNSQSGTNMIIDGSYDKGTGPYDNLLRVNGCLGCHAATDGSTWKGIGGAPIVFNTSPPLYGARYKDEAYQGLAGGNFYWVYNGDDTKGHNVFPGEPDENMDNDAPGRPLPGEGDGDGRCFQNNSCHVNLHAPFDKQNTPGLQGRQGCTGCHMMSDDQNPFGFHHADDSDTIINDFPWYRFLQGHYTEGPESGGGDGDNHGVSGIEDPNWQLKPTSSVHNEYLGKYEDKNDDWTSSLSNRTMSSFCCGCHGIFHEQERDGAWIRHPADAVIPSWGEYNSYTIYNPLAPVARPDLAAFTDPNNVDDEDMVMCLSCHRPHGSPYPDMLRWNYEDMKVGSGTTGGCMVCHTEKGL